MSSYTFQIYHSLPREIQPCPERLQPCNLWRPTLGIINACYLPSIAPRVIDAFKCRYVLLYEHHLCHKCGDTTCGDPFLIQIPRPGSHMIQI